MKKIFILTGEPSGDKLGSTVISQLIRTNPDIEYLSVGGEHLNSLGIKSIFDQREVTYMGFTSVLLNIFKIRNRINKTVDEIIKFPKQKQDLRIDLPTIGLDTLKDCKKAGIKGIVLKSKQNIFMDKNKCINFANKNKIFIKVN